MEYNSDRGQYSPSLFRLKINAIHEFDSLANLPLEVLSTFFHEYFHFIQELTTVFGLEGAWNSFDRFRQVIAYSQKLKTVQIPITAELPTLEENKIILRSLLGSNTVTCHAAEDPDSFSIDRIVYSRNDLASKKSDGNWYDVLLHLKSKSGQNGT